MASEMRVRILQGVSAGAVGQVLNLAGRLLLVPLFLKTWGSEAYGEWLMLSTLPAWLALSDLGGQVYFVNRLTMAWAARDIPMFRKVLGTAIAVFLLLPGFLFLIFSFLISIFPIPALLGVSATPPPIGKGAMLFLAFQVLVSLPQGLVLGVYRAIGELPRGVMLGNGMLLGQLLLTAGILALNGSMVTVAAVQSLPAVAVAVYALRDIRGRLPTHGLFNPRYYDKSIAQKALRPSLHFFGIQMAQALVIQGSTMVVGWALGSVEVVVFATMRMLINLARQVLGLLSHSAWPEFTRLEGNGEYAHLTKLLQTIGRASFIGALALSLVLTIFGREIFTYWLSGRLEYNAAAMSAFCAYILLSVHWTLHANLLMAINRHEVLARWQIFFSATGVMLCYVGALTGALDRAVLGLVIGEAVPMMIVTITLVRISVIGFPIQTLIRGALPHIFAAAMLLVYPPAAGLIFLWTCTQFVRQQSWRRQR